MFVGWLAIDPDAIKSVVGCAALVLFKLHLSFFWRTNSNSNFALLVLLTY